MAQFVRPIADLDNTGLWTTTPLWSKIDDSVGSGDADFISSDASPVSGEMFTVDGSTVTDPVSSIDHILRIRSSKTAGGANNDVVVELRQGYTSEASQGTLIATLTGLVTTDVPTTFTLTLSAAQANSITNYADLQFRCWMAKNGGGASSQGFIYDVELEVPNAGSQTYDESISFSANSTVATSNIATLIGDTTLNLASQIANANNAIMDSGVSFSANSQISESGGLDFQESISLALQSALSTTLNLEINGSVTIVSNSSIVTINNAAVNNAVAIASSPGVFVNGILDMEATVSLLASAIISSQGGSVFDASIGISSNATLSSLLEAILESQITIGSVAQIIANANIDSDATISIGSNNILSVNGGVELDANVSFASIINVITSGGLSLDGNVTMSLIASIDPQNNNIANVSITISSASLIGIVGDGGGAPVVNVIINAKVPVGKHIDNIIMGSYVKSEPKYGKLKEFAKALPIVVNLDNSLDFSNENYTFNVELI